MGKYHGSETQFEVTTIERLQLLGYTHLLGLDIERDPREVVLVPVLRKALASRYPDLPTAAIDSAVERLRLPEGADTLRRNQSFHCELLTRGFEVTYEAPRGEFKAPAVYPGRRIESEVPGARRIAHIHPIDWEHPEKNDFHVVNQLPVSGKNDRRPDIVIYVNGLPLVVFELKNPYAEDPTVEDALNQIGHYTVDIPQLFEFNALCVVSDGANSLHGIWSAGREWYAPWKSIDGQTVESGKTGSMKTLVEGLFRKDRLLAYIRDFIVFEVDKSGIAKKGAKYHQFFAVQRAVQLTLKAFDPGGDKRIGVVWHTTGAGKSLSMAFLVGILRREPKLRNPTFVAQVDRTDLDDQLHDQFVVARHLVGDVRQAESIDDLRELLGGDGGEVIFTTIEKFSLKQDKNKKKETEHPVLSLRDNIIVIADEAHRSQYGFMKGFARYLNEALPNAKRLGFTGTPVSFAAADTVEVFGDYIHTYDIRQAQEDGATVPIYYTPRQAKLHLSRADIDGALADLTGGYTAEQVGDLERRKNRWTALAAAAGAKDRVKEIAKDLLAHFLDRTKTLAGKALVVCMTRRNCVRMYDELTDLPGCPEVKIVMTGDLGEDPKAWSEAGHIATKTQRDGIKSRMVDPDDPLKIVIVCDMWLTGTDIPCLHTLYVDKPMRGHNVIQAISRVNRVFRDKPHGLIVDYIGIGDELREATDKYTRGGGQGEPAPDVEAEALPLFLAAVQAVRAALPDGSDYAGWRKLSGIVFEDLHMGVYGWLTEVDARRDAFLDAELTLTHTYLLVKHLSQASAYADEVIFCQRVRKQIAKTLPGKKAPKDLEGAVRDLLDDHVEAEGVFDIFRLAGIPTPDVSILDERFLQTFKDRPHENLRLKLLEKLIRDELTRRAARNLAKTKSFRELLEATLDRYHKRIIDAAAVVKAMAEIKKEMDADERRAKELGLSDEELAFYDSVHARCKDLYDEPFLRGLVHDVVATITT